MAGLYVFGPARTDEPLDEPVKLKSGKEKNLVEHVPAQVLPESQTSVQGKFDEPIAVGAYLQGPANDSAVADDSEVHAAVGAYVEGPVLQKTTDNYRGTSHDISGRPFVNPASTIYSTVGIREYADDEQSQVDLYLGRPGGLYGGSKAVSKAGSEPIIRSKQSEVQELSYLISALTASEPKLMEHIRDSVADYVAKTPTLQVRYNFHLDKILHSQPARDWNREYQQILSQLPYDWVQEPFKKLSGFAREFFYFAEMYARVIVSELSLPNHQRTIPEVALGGVAGGAKYVCNNILFKLALDTHGIYGSDAAAMKAAGAELTTLIALMGLARNNMIRLPLMCIIDYLGYRLVAMTLLPISRDTLRYGSHNGGVSVMMKDKILIEEMDAMAALLNLKKHKVGLKHDVEISWPVDIEGHRGRDGIPYMVDLARTFPPEAPLDQEKPSMSRLLRPELVREWRSPLSSDAFSGFGGPDNAAIHNPEVTEATHHLYDVVIPKFARYLDKKLSVKKDKFTPRKLVSELHKFGINCRHMGRVRHLCVSVEARALLFTEMVARVLKSQLRDKMRGISSLDLLKDVVVQHCNSFLKQCSDIKEFKIAIQNQFPHCLSESELTHAFEIRTHVDFQLCWHRLEYFVGVQFDHDSLQEMIKDPRNFYFVSSDISSFTAHTKTANLIPFADGVVYAIMAKEATNKYHKERLYQQAKSHLLSALRSAPWDYRAAFLAANLEYTFGLTGRTNNEEQIVHLVEAKRMFKITGNVKPDCPYVRVGLNKVRTALEAAKAGQTPKYSPLMTCENSREVEAMKVYESHVAEFSPVPSAERGAAELADEF